MTRPAHIPTLVTAIDRLHHTCGIVDDLLEALYDFGQAINACEEETGDTLGLPGVIQQLTGAAQILQGSLDAIDCHLDTALDVGRAAAYEALEQEARQVTP